VRAAIALVFLLAGGCYDFDALESRADGGGCGTFARPAVSSFSDRFTAGGPGSNWTSFGTCIQEIGGELIATPPASTSTNTYCLYNTAQSYHLTCDRLSVRVTPTTTPTAAGAQTVIYAGQGSEEIQLILEGGGFTLTNVGLSWNVNVPGPYDPTQDVWWSLRESGGQLYFETSADGSHWKIRGQGPDPFSLDAVIITIGAGVWKSVANPGQAHFACYNVSAPCP
jgi:hypothetical protein